MVPKILLFILIGCTAVLASPTNRKVACLESLEESSTFLEFLKNSVDNLLGKFYDAIIKSLQKVSRKIEERLDSKEFREAIEELEKVATVIFNENEGLHGNDKTKEIIQKQLEKIGEVFEAMVEETLENPKEMDKTVDASEFKNSVDELKQLVDQLYQK